MAKIALMISFLCMWCLVTAPASATPTDLASADWSVKSAHNLAVKPPSDDVVKAFMAKLEGGPGPNGICFARFVDLRHSGNLSLVVAEGEGTSCFLSVIDRTPRGFERYDFPNDTAHGSGAPEIRDLAGDGNLELIVDAPLTDYQGANYCQAVWPLVYAWTGNGYSDVSSRYRAFYKQALASLKKQIAAAQNSVTAPSAASGPGQPQPVEAPVRSHGGVSVGFGPVLHGPRQLQPQPQAPSKEDVMELNCTKAEAAKIKRFLGISRDAGLKDAIKWANSDDRLTREFAVGVLTDIGTPDAIEYLKTLSHDPERPVAAEANESVLDARAGRRQPLMLDTVEREPVAGNVK
jgi:hypothetical protein